MIIIEIESAATNTKAGTSRDSGKPWTMTFQQIIISGHYVDGFSSRLPRESSIQLDEGQNPYPVGKYAIDAASFYFGDFGRFTLGRIKLQPLSVFVAEIEKQMSVTVTKAVKAAA